MKALYIAAAAALAVMLAAGSASANLFDQLPAEARARLERGEQVVYTRDVPGSNWPAVSVYQLLKAKPEEAMAVFTDFGAQASYLRECCGVLQSVVRDPAVGGNRRVRRVFYEIQVPIIANEKYELIEELSKSADGSYTVSWRKANGGGHSEDIYGRARFEPHNGRTLFYYYNYVKMTAFGSAVLSGQSVERSKTTVRAIARHIDQLHERGGSELSARIRRLREALGS